MFDKVHPPPSGEPFESNRGYTLRPWANTREFPIDCHCPTHRLCCTTTPSSTYVASSTGHRVIRCASELLEDSASVVVCNRDRRGLGSDRACVVSRYKAGTRFQTSISREHLSRALCRGRRERILKSSSENLWLHERRRGPLRSRTWGCGKRRYLRNMYCTRHPHCRRPSRPCPASSHSPDLCPCSPCSYASPLALHK